MTEGALILCALLRSPRARGIARHAAECDAGGAYRSAAYFWIAALDTERAYRGLPDHNQPRKRTP